MSTGTAERRGGDGICRILLVDDNPLDARMFAAAARRARIGAEMAVVGSGERAVELIGSGVGFDLILLDLNLPGIDGIEVLKRLKADSVLRIAPVIVFSSSQNQADVDAAYLHGAAAYVSKPMGSPGYDEVVRSMASFWNGTASLPRS